MATIEQKPFSLTPNEGASIVSWGAIFSGVFIAAALYLVLLILGTGLGFSLVSPWNLQGYASGTIGWVAVAWIILAQIISSGGGGYIAGRLLPLTLEDPNSSIQKVQKTRFYNMAHGLLVWALSTIAIAFLLGTAASNMLSGGASVVAAVGKGVGTGAGIGLGAGAGHLGSTLALPGWNGTQEGQGDQSGDGIIDYAIDMLIRPASNSKSDGSDDQNTSSATREGNSQLSGTQRKEIARILINSVQKNEISSADKNYVVQLVANRTGISQTEVNQRIDEVLQQIHSTLNKGKSKTKEMLESAREAAAMAALLSFITLLLGAIAAAAAACYGSSWIRRHQ